MAGRGFALYLLAGEGGGGVKPIPTTSLQAKVIYSCVSKEKTLKNVDFLKKNLKINKIKNILTTDK